MENSAERQRPFRKYLLERKDHMSGITGIYQYEKEPSAYYDKVSHMLLTLSHRGAAHQKRFTAGHMAMGICSAQKEFLATTFSFEGVTYSLLLDGEIFPTYRLAETLDCSSHALSPEECLLAYHRLGSGFLKLVDGSFALAIYNHTADELFLARDAMGVRPLFYAQRDGVFYFGSEIKALLQAVPAVLDARGITELFSLSPAASPDHTLFSGIQTLPEGCFLRARHESVHIEPYFSLSYQEHRDSLYETGEKVRHLVERSVHNYVDCEGRPAAFLSGGLDSSILCCLASVYVSNRSKTLQTFSIAYKDNEKYFSQNSYQPDMDDSYIALLLKQLDAEHHTILLEPRELADALEDAVVARDLPGMADIDSSLLLAAREVGASADWVLSGECADEVFCGYPWFHREDLLAGDVFPWSGSLRLRRMVLSPDLAVLPIEETARAAYQGSLSRHMPPVGVAGREHPGLYETNLQWFGGCLLRRKDAMTSYAGLTAKLPFASPFLAQYVYSIPPEILETGNREKGILRYAFSDLLPREIFLRKKNPYPKTFDPAYAGCVRERLRDVLLDPNAPLRPLVDQDALLAWMDSGAAMDTPWFGQLMRGPQFFAFLLQVNIWLEKYHVSLRPGSNPL